MNRRKFIQLTSLTSLGLFLGFDALGNASASESIFSIGSPIIHGRHGLFDLQNIIPTSDFTIQRNIMTRDGIDMLSEDRITTINIINQDKESFQILDKNIENIERKNLTIQKINKNKPFTLSSSNEKLLVFSECTNFTINKAAVKDSEGCFLAPNEKHIITSEIEQFVMIYNT